MAIKEYNSAERLPSLERRSSVSDSQSRASSVSDLREYVYILRRRWWLVALAGVVCSGAAWWTQHDRVAEYKAEALIQLKRDAPVVGQGFLSAGTGEGFATQLQIIRSRSVIEPVVDSLGLQLRFRTREGDRSRILATAQVEHSAPSGTYQLTKAGDGLILLVPKEEQVIARSSSVSGIDGPGFSLKIENPNALNEPVEFSVTNRQRAVERVQHQVKVEQGTGPDLIWIEFSHPDPELAAAVANAVARRYQAYRGETAREAAARRRSVIADQLVQIADSLRAVQASVSEYQESQQLLNPQVETNALLEAELRMEDELRSLRFQESQLQGLVQGLRTAEAGDASVQQLVALSASIVPGGSGYQRRLEDLQARRQELTASRFGYTEENPEVQTVDSLIASARSNVQAAAEQALEQVRARIESTSESLGGVRGEVSQVPARSAEYERLQQRANAVQGVFDNLVEQYYQAQIAEGVETGDVQVVDPATVPLGPEPGREGLIMVLALLAGLGIGAIGAGVWEQFDSSVRLAPEAEKVARLRVLGTVPRIRSGADPKHALPAKESFRVIRTNLMFSVAEDISSLTVTSAGPVEGKSTVAANLGVTVAEQGSRVLLIDADLRRPAVHKVFGIKPRPGLSDVASGDVSIDQAIQDFKSLPGLELLPAGRRIGNPAALLGGDFFRELLDSLRARYDLVIVDTPPVLAVTDASLVAARTEGTIMVVRSEVTHREELEQATDQLRRVGAQLLGLVLNGVVAGGPYYQTKYTDYYTRMEIVDVEDDERSRRVLVSDQAQ